MEEKVTVPALSLCIKGAYIFVCNYLYCILLLLLFVFKG